MKLQSGAWSYRPRDLIVESWILNLRNFLVQCDRIACFGWHWAALRSPVRNGRLHRGARRFCCRKTRGKPGSTGNRFVMNLLAATLFPRRSPQLTRGGFGRVAKRPPALERRFALEQQLRRGPDGVCSCPGDGAKPDLAACTELPKGGLCDLGDRVSYQLVVPARRMHATSVFTARKLRRARVHVYSRGVAARPVDHTLWPTGRSRNCSNLSHAVSRYTNKIPAARSSANRRVVASSRRPR